MPANLENSPMAMGLGKVSFHSNLKEMQCQRMFKLLYNFICFTCWQGDAQNPLNQASTVHEPRTSRCTSWIYKRQRNQRSNHQHPLDHRKSKGIPEKKKNICFIDYAKAFDCVDHNKLWDILKETGVPDHLIYLLRILYAGQEERDRTGHGTIDWFKIGKGRNQGFILSPCSLSYMQSTSCEMPGWMKHKQESRLPGYISITSDMQMIPPLWHKATEN